MIVWKIGNIFASLPLICFWTVLFMKFDERKYEFRINIIVLATTCAVLYFLTDGMQKEALLKKEMIQAVAVIGISLFLVGGKFEKKIRAVICIYLWMVLIDSSVSLFMWILKMKLTQIQWQYAEIILGKNIYNLIIYIIFVFYKLFQERKSREHLIFLTFFSCIFAVVQTIFYYYLFLSNVERLTPEIIAVITICSVMILGDCAMTLLLMEKMIQNQHDQNEEEKRILGKKYEHDYYLLAKEQSEVIKQVSTDMQSQLKTVQDLIYGYHEGDREQVEHILDRLEEEVSQIGRVYYCADPVLNTILSLKQDEAKKVGVDMEIKVDSVVKTEVEDIDLCCIITNLLDNAIESAQSVKREIDDRKEKKIVVNIGCRGGYLAMKIANPALSLPIKNKGGRYKSSKKYGKSGEHGRGLGIVEKTVQKYNGYLKMKKEEKEVVVTVFLREEMA